MQRRFILLICFLLVTFAGTRPPRLLVTTDIGVDPYDQQLVVRLMDYTYKFEIVYG